MWPLPGKSYIHGGVESRGHSSGEGPFGEHVNLNIVILNNPPRILQAVIHLALQKIDLAKREYFC
jgi:hypothetical protein